MALNGMKTSLFRCFGLVVTYNVERNFNIKSASTYVKFNSSIDAVYTTTTAYLSKTTCASCARRLRKNDERPQNSQIVEHFGC